MHFMSCATDGRVCLKGEKGGRGGFEARRGLGEGCGVQVTCCCVKTPSRQACALSAVTCIWVLFSCMAQGSAGW